jgi:hypothetical protein
LAQQKKSPTFRDFVEQQKKPRVASNPESYHKLYPSWRIAKMEFVDPFGWHVLDATSLSYVRGKLSEFETRTWGEILNSKHNHPVEKGRLCKHAQDRLDEMKQYDLEEVLSIRLSGAERIWGVLSEGVCTIFWWDPEHQVCPSMKR